MRESCMVTFNNLQCPLYILSSFFYVFLSIMKGWGWVRLGEARRSPLKLYCFKQPAQYGAAVLLNSHSAGGSQSQKGMRRWVTCGESGEICQRKICGSRIPGKQWGMLTTALFLNLTRSIIQELSSRLHMSFERHTGTNKLLANCQALQVLKVCNVLGLVQAWYGLVGSAPQSQYPEAFAQLQELSRKQHRLASSTEECHRDAQWYPMDPIGWVSHRSSKMDSAGLQVSYFLGWKGIHLGVAVRILHHQYGRATLDEIRWHAQLDHFPYVHIFPAYPAEWYICIHPCCLGCLQLPPFSYKGPRQRERGSRVSQELKSFEAQKLSRPEAHIEWIWGLMW